MDRFAKAYNHAHHTSPGSAYSPPDVHYGHALNVSTQRSLTLAAARQSAHKAIPTGHDPEILVLPANARINQPVTNPAA